MTAAVAELDALVDAVRAEPAIADDVAAAVAAWKEPVRVLLAGRPGVGLTTVAAALGMPADTEIVRVDDPHQSADAAIDADVVIYVLAASATETDEAVVDSLVRRPPRSVETGALGKPRSVETGALGKPRSVDTVVVLNKADAVAARWSKVLEVVREHAAELRAPTFPLVASLAARTRGTMLTDAELRSLKQLAAVPDATLTMSPELFLGAHVGTDVRARRTMLERWDLFGLDCAIEALRADATLDASQLLQVMHAASAVDELLAAVHAHITRVGAVRGGALLDSLEQCAARSVSSLPDPAPDAADPSATGTASARDIIETFLRGDVACRLGLAAGLACPELSRIAAEYRTVEPKSPQDALARADRWRAVVSAEDVSPSGRRAARRIHQGYIRLWEQSTAERGVPSEPASPEGMSRV